MSADLEARVAELERDLEAMTVVAFAVLFASHTAPFALLELLDQAAPGTRDKTAELVQSSTALVRSQEAVLGFIDNLIVANPDSALLRRLRAMAETEVQLDPSGEH